MLEILKNEWEVLSRAPLTFVSFAVAAVIVTTTISSAFWGSILAHTRASFDADLKAAKAELVAAENAKTDLQQRLGFYPRDGKFEKLTHSELSRFALDLCDVVEAKASMWEEKRAPFFNNAERDALRAEYKEFFEKLQAADEENDQKLLDELLESDEHQTFNKKLNAIWNAELKQAKVDRGIELQDFGPHFAELRSLRTEIAKRLPAAYERSLFGSAYQDDERAAAEVRSIDERFIHPCSASSRTIVPLVRTLALALDARDDGVLPPAGTVQQLRTSP